MPAQAVLLLLLLAVGNTTSRPPWVSEVDRPNLASQHCDLRSGCGKECAAKMGGPGGEGSDLRRSSHSRTHELLLLALGSTALRPPA